MVKVLFLAGSARKDSVNKKLAKQAAEQAKETGAEVAYIDLADYDMPIYNGDLEDAEGLPENAKKLKQLFIAHDGFFISSPEYNSSISPLLKNALDWISRQEEGDAGGLVAYKDKVAALVAASPGGLGGMRGLVVLRMMLGNIGVHVVPNQFALGGAMKAFNDEGALVDVGNQSRLQVVVEQFIETTKQIAAVQQKAA